MDDNKGFVIGCRVTITCLLGEEDQDAMDPTDIGKRRKYVNESGVITKDWGYGNRFVVKFDNEILEISNSHEGYWCWDIDEIRLEVITFNPGDEVIVNTNHDSSHMKLEFDEKKARINYLHDDASSLFIYSLIFENADVQANNHYCWSAGELIMSKKAKGLVIDGNTNMVEGDKVLIMSVYRPDNKAMNAFVGHTAVVLKIDTIANFYPVSLKFDNKKLQELYKNNGSLRFTKEELVIINDLGFNDMQQPEIRKGDTVVILKNTGYDSTKRNPFVNEIGTIRHIDGNHYMFDVCFEDDELQKQNVNDGGWLWEDDEIIFIKREGVVLI